MNFHERKAAYEKAYEGIPKVKLTFVAYCCSQALSLMEEIPVGVCWVPIISCPTCFKTYPGKIVVGSVRQ